MQFFSGYLIEWIKSIQEYHGVEPEPEEPDTPPQEEMEKQIEEVHESKEEMVDLLEEPEPEPCIEEVPVPVPADDPADLLASFLFYSFNIFI